MPIRHVLLSAVLAASLFAAGAAQAQINPFRSSSHSPRLSSADLALMEQAGQKLLGETAPATGASEAWHNDDTGAAGQVAFIGPTQRTVRGTTFACRRLSYTVTLRNRPTPRTTHVNWCRQPDGTWKMN